MSQREVLYRAIAQCAFALVSIPLMNMNNPVTATLATIVVLFGVDIVLMVRGRKPLNPRLHFTIPLVTTIIASALAVLLPTTPWFIATASGFTILVALVITGIIIDRGL